MSLHTCIPFSHQQQHIITAQRKLYNSNIRTYLIYITKQTPLIREIFRNAFQLISILLSYVMDIVKHVINQVVKLFSSASSVNRGDTYLNCTCWYPDSVIIRVKINSNRFLNQHAVIAYIYRQMYKLCR